MADKLVEIIYLGSRLLLKLRQQAHF